MVLRRSVVLLAVALVASPALADVVQLTDGTRFVGVITHNGPDGVSIRSGGNDWAFHQSEIAFVKYEGDGVQKERSTRYGAKLAKSQLAGLTPVPTSDAQVVLYGTHWCSACARAREYFRQHDISFLDRDIQTDADARQEVIRKCAAAGQPFNGAVPVIDVNGSIIHGFSPLMIRHALNHSE